MAEQNIEDAKKFNPRLYCPAETNKKRDQFLKDAQTMKFEDLKRTYLKPRPILIRMASLIIEPKIKHGIKRIFKILKTSK